jgi:hypothetical protein
MGKLAFFWANLTPLSLQGALTHYNWDHYDSLLEAFASSGVRPLWTFCCVDSGSSTGSACPGTYWPFSPGRRRHSTLSLTTIDCHSLGL